MALSRIVAQECMSVTQTARIAASSRPYSVQSRIHEAVDKSKEALMFAKKKAGDAYEGAKHAAEDAYHYAEDTMHKVGSAEAGQGEPQAVGKDIPELPVVDEQWENHIFCTCILVNS
ncbi:hypothetical protein QR680_014480 [Steinernema hermaphroditum]|uniref:Uncharacterized protein n=1 Tax=Steinernema hermaphroditum TaxID=289476 RepID=A0AA39IB71_9BILA|nr:hypothetical protein QR680_014480 [Steinernema hermaphroditum]